MPKKEQGKKNNNIFLIILLVLILVAILFLPNIYKYVETLKMPKIHDNKNVDDQKIKEVDSETLESLHRPLMRSSIYYLNSYYNLDTFKISNMDNNDILYNAFLDIYEGNMTSYDNAACSATSKQFNKDYIELRIKNILGKNVNYTLKDFYVPQDSTTPYVGTWIYDGQNSRYIYNGLCEQINATTKYYNLEQFIKAEYENKDIVVYYYVGFAKVEGDNFTIYKNPDMTEELLSGKEVSVDELNSNFKDIDDANKKIYKYTFKNNLCTYDEYCLYEGKWINEL